MKIKFTAPILVATIALSSTLALTAKAQTGPKTVFYCVYQDGAWQTVAKRGNSRPTPPIITWKYKHYEFSPKQRCEIVSEKLADLAYTHGGKLYGIRMKTGYVNNSPVICYVDNTTKPFCDRYNHLMNLPTGSNPKLELERLFARIDTPYATGTSVQNSAPDYEVKFGDAVEKLLNAAQNQEDGNGSTVEPTQNQNEGNDADNGSI